MLRELPTLPRNDAPCLFDDGSARGPSMVELEARVSRHARHLQELGIRRLAWSADNGFAWPALELAALRAGVILVPLPADAPWEQVRHALRVAGCDALLTDAPDSLAPHLGHGEALPEIFGARGWRVDPDGRVAPLPPETARITFTRGVTGPPRGVCHSSERIWSIAAALAEALRSSTHDLHMALLPLSGLGSAVWTVYGALVSGSRAIFPPLRPLGLAGGARPSAVAIARAVARHAPTTLLITPAILESWLAVPEELAPIPAEMRRIVTVGAPLSRALSRLAEERRWPVYEGYALEELGSVAAMNDPRAVRRGTVGRAIAGIDVRVAADGELWVRAPSHAGIVDETGFVPAGEECATGDIGHCDAEGYLSILGRKRHRIITKEGRTFCPEWLEETLRRQSSIADAFVFGDDKPYLAAVILPVPGREAQVERELRQVNLHLPEHARLGRWHILDRPLAHDERTLTPSGRPNRAEIYARWHTQIFS